MINKNKRRNNNDRCKLEQQKIKMVQSNSAEERRKLFKTLKSCSRHKTLKESSFKNFRIFIYF